MKQKKYLFSHAYQRSASVILLGFCTLNAHAAGLPTMNGPSGTSNNDPFTSMTTVFKWGLTVVGYGLCALIFLTVAKNVWAKYHSIGEENSRTTWREVVVHGIVGMGVLLVSLILVTQGLSVFGESEI